jgi:hypothetical protein
MRGMLSMVGLVKFRCRIPDRVSAIAEPLNDNGTMRTDVFYNTLNTSYINIALQTAHAADPNAKLYINDYNLEYTGRSNGFPFALSVMTTDVFPPGPKIDAMVQLVKDLLAAGAPIHGIGFESHLILGEVSPSELQANMERITTLGLEVAVTELDDRIELPATDADLEQQKADYMSVVQTCMAVDGCVGVTVWDYTDRVRSAAPSYSTIQIDCSHHSILGFHPSSPPLVRLARGTRYVIPFEYFHAIFNRNICRIWTGSQLTMALSWDSWTTLHGRLHILMICCTTYCCRGTSTMRYTYNR